MSFTKKCPACDEKLPFFKMKGKLKCPACGKWIQEDPKTANLYSFLILFAVLLAYPIDWRLSVVSAGLMSALLMFKLKYTVVVDDDE